MKYLDIFVNKGELNEEDYIVVEYKLSSKTNLREAAYNLAVGQTIGNPSLRNEFETPELVRDYCAKIYCEDYDSAQGTSTIFFPKRNWNPVEDGIPGLLVQIFGGQVDIDVIQSCEIVSLRIPNSHLLAFKGPKFGISGIKDYCSVNQSSPLFGGIVKPKIGMSPEGHLEIVKRLVDGGCNFIKEDEILSQQSWCDINKRTELVMNYIRDTGSKTFYCVSLQSKSSSILKKLPELVSNYGCNGVHVNFHAGFGVYQELRDLNLPVIIHYQKSGDRLLSHQTHAFRISEHVLFYLASISGCDTLHAGMIGGYLNSDEESLKKSIDMLVKNNSVPALSCGMHPGLVEFIINNLGHSNWMANVGGALMSHPMGTLSGVTAMKQAVTMNYGTEYYEAIKKWGKR